MKIFESSVWKAVGGMSNSNPRMINLTILLAFQETNKRASKQQYQIEDQLSLMCTMSEIKNSPSTNKMYHVETGLNLSCRFF